ncbi:hypothetical protein P8452_66737 [Trifolium repens]|nr:hypothetical protein P8452_66737 [Trifolium repens]
MDDESVLKYIEQSLSSIHNGKTNHRNGLTALELKRTDRVGLLSEMFAVLAELQCDVVEAKVWIHNGRIVSLIYVKACNTGTSIEDYQKINRLEARLRYVLQGDSHKNPIFEFTSETPLVIVQNWAERGYSVVNVQCKDRAKLLFDVVCNLTEMEYVVFHATINTRIDQAYLEFYKRHKDGTPISSEPERQHVMQGAVERRSCVGVRLELSTEDRQGLLAKVVRTFRENGLNVTMADIGTRGDLAANTVYVTDAIGYLLGLLTGFFIDSGDGVTHVFPVVNGYSFPHLTKQMNVAAYLVDLLSRRGYAVSRTADFETVRAIKEKLCYIRLITNLKTKIGIGLEITIFVKNFTLPDGRVIKVGTERFQAREALFTPLVWFVKIMMFFHHSMEPQAWWAYFLS